MKLLLTGATGYLGKHLLARLLRDGHQVWALVRATDGAAQARVVAALRPFALTPRQLTPPQLQVLVGDVSAAGCALTPEDFRTLQTAGCTALLHCAGLTRFESHLTVAVQLHNVVGTQRVFELAAALAIPHFHHMSTAFVAGRTAQVMGAEDLDIGQTFNNPYEASKFAAEVWLRAQPLASYQTLMIHRPSIVVGGNPIGANHSVSTLYTFMKPCTSSASVVGAIASGDAALLHASACSAMRILFICHCEWRQIRRR
jgi:thioester reductase-like protein